MRCLAVMVDIDEPAAIDSVIFWEKDGQPAAFAYLDGKIIMTRPLSSETLDGCVAEVREAWGIPFGRVARIQEWVQVG